MRSSAKELPIFVFADGACSGNPGPGGWGAILVFPDGHVTELGGRAAPTTNNKMELTAVLSALRRLEKRGGEIEIYTDSTYVIHGITRWIWGWRNRNWKTAEGKPVANGEIWKLLFQEVTKRIPMGKIHWNYVKGHSGIPGNERVDVIAVEFSQGHRPTLYDGPLLRYDVPVHDLPENTEVPEPKLKNREPKAQPYSYLSIVGGVPMRHLTWAECERRVKGHSGAKFKKAMSAEQEKAILKEWGLKPAQFDSK